MNKKLKGFSLAELLISLLIISIVLSAAIPTITRKAGADRENIWRWTNEGNNAYFGTGSNQSAILGLSSAPQTEDSIASIFQDLSIIDNSVDDVTDAGNTGTQRANNIGNINIGDLKYSNFGDKFIILKKTIQNDNSNFMNSHISFYTMKNDDAATTADIKYAGRLALDPGNIALGLGTLQRINSDNIGENTAIGHFALFRTDEGFRNTAIGKKALSHNESGAYNTAVGFGSLYSIGKADSSDTDAYYENTAIGALSQQEKETGRFNTSVGSQSLKRNITGDSNTAVGRLALGNLESGNNNTAIGDKACRYIEAGNNNICIGNGVSGLNNDSYGLYIGSQSDTQTTETATPLIGGHTNKSGTTIDKELIVNAKYVEFRPAYGTKPSFLFESWAGDTDTSTTDGYGFTSKGQHGIARFYLKDGGNGASANLEFHGDFNGSSIFTYIDSYDPYNTSNTGNVDIMFNRILTFDFPPANINGTSSNSKISIKTNNSSAVNTLVFNDKLEVEYNSNTPKLSLNNTGFTLSNKNNREQIKAVDYGLTLGNSSNSIYIGTNQNEIRANTEIFSVVAKDYNVEISDNASIKLSNVFIDNNDIKLNGIPSEGSVKNNIKELWEKVNTLQSGYPSDARLKNIQGDSTAGLNEINALEVKNYTYKNDKDKTPHVGVIAQQLKKVFPNSVIKDKDGYLKIKTEEIFYAMVNSIKELCAKLQELTAKVTGLDKRITELEQQNKLLLEQNKAFEKRLEKLEKQSAK